MKNGAVNGICKKKHDQPFDGSTKYTKLYKLIIKYKGEPTLAI